MSYTRLISFKRWQLSSPQICEGGDDQWSMPEQVKKLGFLGMSVAETTICCDLGQQCNSATEDGDVYRFHLLSCSGLSFRQGRARLISCVVASGVCLPFLKSAQVKCCCSLHLSRKQCRTLNLWANVANPCYTLDIGLYITPPSNLIIEDTSIFEKEYSRTGTQRL